MGSVGKKPLAIQYRGQWDIISSILRVGTTGRSKTYIMHKCNLSYRQLRAYLDLLRERGLLRLELNKEKGNLRKILVTTDKGHAFLKAYNNLRTTIDNSSLKFALKI